MITSFKLWSLPQAEGLGSILLQIACIEEYLAYNSTQSKRLFIILGTVLPTKKKSFQTQRFNKALERYNGCVDMHESYQWRLILSEPSSGSWNMALDEALLESTSSKLSPPSLRLYSWSPPCVSLGFAQPIEHIDLKRLSLLGWGIVRRPTGGRAILHTDELTYSVTVPADNPNMSGSVLSGYKYISGGLVSALEELGAEVEVQPEVQLDQETRSQPVCFEIPSSYEITVDGKKLIGSAQTRRKGGILQHGTLPLRGDIARICQVLNYEDEAHRENAAQGVRERASTIERCLGRIVSWNEVAQAMQSGFSKALNLELTLSQLTEEEILRARELYENRYGTIEWTERIQENHTNPPG